MQTPLNTVQLSAFLRQHLKLSIASRALIDGHQAPLDYLAHVFFQGRGGFGVHGLARPPRALDSVVWASRGGGKTFLGAVATALDLIFKPGIQIRILGGSLDQSKRMHGYLRSLFDKEALAELVEGRITDGRLALTNGSVVELLAQSHTAVRGTRVHTLRCDEVELFRDDVFDAAMLVTKSGTFDIPGVGPTEIAGSIECMSTMHVPFGLMSRLVKDDTRRVFKWGVVDVLGECEKERECGECELWSECRGRAKRGTRSSERGAGEQVTPSFLAPDSSGHLSIDDAIRMKRRVSLPMWNTEMLCLEPSRADTVFPEFDRARHVFASWEDESGLQEMEEPSDFEWLDPLRPVAIESVFRPAASTFVCGIDFGFRAPTVILWSVIDKQGVLRILDERHVTRKTTKQHAEAILKGNGRFWRVPDWIGADPAGRQHQSQSGKSDVQVLRESGLAVKTRGSVIMEGLNLIRERLSSADGTVRLQVHARCTKLIEAFVQYHYRLDDPEDQNPVKDGHDHAIDALRYLVLNLVGKGVEVRRY